MTNFTNDEMNLMCIYSVGSSRASLMQKLMEMKKYLEHDEVQLLSLTESTAYLIRKKKNSLIKVVTGVRRCGKSYLLFTIIITQADQIAVQTELEYRRKQ